MRQASLPDQMAMFLNQFRYIQFCTLLFMMARMHSMQTWMSSFASPILRRATCRDLLLTPGLSLSS